MVETLTNRRWWKHLCYLYKTVSTKLPSYRYEIIPALQRCQRNLVISNLQDIRLTTRNSHQRCSVKIDVLKNFGKFTGRHLCQSLFLNKAASLSPATLLKKRLYFRCFPLNFAKFLRRPFLQNTSELLLLQLFQNYF